MKLFSHKKEGEIDKVHKQRENSEALKIVRDFQKEYRETIPHIDSARYQWNTKQTITDQGALKAQNYNQSSLSIL